MIKLEIVTPEKRVVDAEVDSVTVPTASGEAGILPNHAPLVSALRPGVLAYSVKGTASKLAVSSGFVEVNSDKVAVLVDSAESPEEIDVDNAKASREAAEKELAAASQSSVEDIESSRDALDHALARIQVAGGK